jgi:type I restriction enzyme S subunit
MMSVYGQDQIAIQINSSAQGTITVQNVRDFKIPLFKNESIHNRIAESINALSLEISTIINDKKSQLETLEQYKKSLIYEYVTGKKQVKENA